MKYNQKPHVNIGVVGDVGYGKTTLTSAILKRVSEDKGVPESITKEGRVVEYETRNRHYSHTDFANHQVRSGNMLAALSEKAGVVLVVDAKEEPGYLSRSLLLVSRQSGIDRVVVFINKCDLVDDKSKIDNVEAEIRSLLEDYAYDRVNTPVIRGSALTSLSEYSSSADDIEMLINAIDNWIPEKNYTNEHQVDMMFDESDVLDISFKASRHDKEQPWNRGKQLKYTYPYKHGKTIKIGKK